MERFLDAYGEHLEFCQIQLNWFDWLFQKADRKVAMLNARNIPIWVMEPLRGGRLAKLPEIHLKAILTEDNQSWDSVKLHDELLAEKEKIEKAAAEEQ